MAYKNIFSIPVTKHRQSTMKRKFMIFSVILFLMIFVLVSVTFFLLMERILHSDSGNELMKTIELERLRLEASVEREIAVVYNMSESPLIKRYLTNPENQDLKELVYEEIGAYSRTLGERSIFWINNKDKIFYTTDHDSYILDPENTANYWYNMTLYETEGFNLNINYNNELNVTNLWINAPVFDSAHVPVGMVGTGINLTNFINNIYKNYIGNSHLYFFNASGEITGAKDIDLVKNKINIKNILGDGGDEIFNQIKNLGDSGIINFRLDGRNVIAALGTISALNWYVTAVHSYTILEPLQTGMTILLAVMMTVVFAVLMVFNIFVARLMEPLYSIVKKISQISSDWDLKDHDEINKMNEIGTLGEFLTMTIIDPLTGVYNRRFLDGNMKVLIKTLSRTGGKLSLLMIDIDFFKKYNDTYGHEMGDKCLQEVSNALNKSITREEDFLARYGGEEFVVVLPNTDESGAALIAEKLLKNVIDCKIINKNNDASPYVTISIGGTTGAVKYSHNESDYIKPADTALYRSKQNGRNRYTFENFNKEGEEE